jgi:uncharacterized membrane protein
MLKRLKNPIFLMALASITYTILSKLGVKLTTDEFKIYVDLLSYILLGAGVYTSFDKK